MLGAINVVVLTCLTDTWTLTQVIQNIEILGIVMLELLHGNLTTRYMLEANPCSSFSSISPVEI